jgi:predicted acetyltransferase
MCSRKGHREANPLLTLRAPTVELFPLFVEMSADYARHGESRYQRENGWDLASFADYVRHLVNNSRGIDLEPGRSAETTYWLIKDDQCIVGTARIRKVLNPDLLQEGGNIGYGVPPSQRRKGFGTELLRQTVEKARELGLTRVLVTCDKANEPSRKIIERNGGILDSEGISEESGEPILRFWIRP